MKFLKDYDFTLHYHPGKANVVAGALNRKSRGALASIASREWQMLETVGQFGLQYNEQTQGMLGSLDLLWTLIHLGLLSGDAGLKAMVARLQNP